MPPAEVAQVGWDLGGAHVKVAALDARGRAVAALQVPCALWRGLDQLEQALEQAVAGLPAGAADARHAATMTGELTDLFADRSEGVQRIVATLKARFGQRHLRVFAGERGLLEPDQALRCWSEVASANWLATAQLVAGHLADALLVDIGTTTTDLVAVRGGRVQTAGRTDFERLVSGELVYTGVVRTALMAVADAIEFEGLRVPLMAESFATTADVYRLTGELDERCDQHASADGSEKTPPASARRLARMIGLDARDRPLQSWQRLAASFRATQLDRIRRAAQQVVLRAAVAPAGPMVAAGSGAFLVPELARELHRPVVGFASLFESRIDDPVALSVCAPAVAVALLAQRGDM
ncbi:MAG TPA: hydantoinase/oxoprolinase family protein [Burkholderiaceae bacterium]|jgi:probable H4MPT-linked C1 transfer pathway protein|nr:hydantoinase/oxoprolinase family protein [Burkholderiaceae bacterium]